MSDRRLALFANPAAAGAIRPEWDVEAVFDDGSGSYAGNVGMVAQDVISDLNPLRHDPEKLTAALMELARRPRVRPVPAIEPRSSVPQVANR